MATMNPGIALTNATAKELRDLKITIAVDISGSTAGNIIKTEIGAIRAILSTMDSKDHDTTSVLPWNSTTHSDITLPSGQVALDYLTGNGGTTRWSLGDFVTV